MNTEIKLHANTEAVVDKLQDQLSYTVEGTTAIITSAEGAYEKLLPSEVPLEAAKALQKFVPHFIAGGNEAVGNLARQIANDNPNVTQVTARIPMLGKDRLDVTWNRSEERNAGIPKSGEVAEKKTVYGTMTAKLTVTGTDAGSGELNKVFKRQKAAALEMFGSPTTA